MDDWDSIQDGPIDLTDFRFVGGVTTADMVLWFDFYDAAMTYVASFGVQLPSGGNFIWTIGLDPPLLVIPDVGRLEVVADSTTSPISEGQWFMGDAVPSPGTQDPNVGSEVTHAHNFELTNTDIPVELRSLAIE